MMTSACKNWGIATPACALVRNDTETEMKDKDRLVKRCGNNSAVPCNINLDFAFELDQETWDGLNDIFNRLADYEDTGLTPSEIAKVASGNRIAGNAL